MAPPSPPPPAILIVDDHDQVRAALRVWLAFFFPHYHVQEARSGEDALALFDAQPPALVVMDLALPRMSGIEVTREIKKRNANLPVVVLSIHESSAHQEQARRAGADAFVFKRVLHNELQQVITRLLDRPGNAPINNIARQ